MPRISVTASESEPADENRKPKRKTKKTALPCEVAMLRLVKFVGSGPWGL